MDFLPYIFTAIVIIIVLVIIRSWLKSLEEKSKVSDELVAWLKDLGSRVDKQTEQMDRKMEHNMDMFNKRLDNAAKVIGDVQKSIGEFSEIGRSMQQLQEFLQSPKLRGNIGEQVLKELLAQSLPPDSFVLQYGFQNGQKVDAIIKTSQGLIPIDSKFPISSFKKMIDIQNAEEKERIKKEFEKEVKVHIKNISQKYILTGEGTIDYALMYIPSESVYYELINSGNLYDYAAEMRVVPVSPMSFYAYLKVILISFEGQRIEKQAKDILSVLQSMKKDYEKADEAMSVLQKHISNAYNQSSQVSKNLMVLGQKIESTGSLPSGKKTEQERLLE
ncbi:MAG TPA: DNA recombination protein RmuC [Candidatus Woesebacteria bacterium]|nr:DNA recombination protein RmuC [Candidatus Woesebacteria bacterium]